MRPDLKTLPTLTWSESLNSPIEPTPGSLDRYREVPKELSFPIINISAWSAAQEASVVEATYDPRGAYYNRTDVVMRPLGEWNEDETEGWSETLRIQRGSYSSLRLLREMSPLTKLAALIASMSAQTAETLILQVGTDDPLREIRELPEYVFDEFMAILYVDLRGESIDWIPWTGALARAKRLPPFDVPAEPTTHVGVGRWEGADGITSIEDDGDSGHYRLIWADGRHRRVLGEELPEALVLATTVWRSLGSSLRRRLQVTFGMDDPLYQVREMAPDRQVAFKAFVDRLSCRLNDVSQWQSALENFDATETRPLCHVSRSGNWYYIHNTLGKVRATAQKTSGKLSRALDSRNTMSVNAGDVEAFARSQLPANSLVESVTALPDGRVRIILREPVRANLVQRYGHTYVEDPPGEVLRDMVVAAFDLDFRSSTNGFPNATAYADRECQRRAKHTNISQHEGRVCLGDLNRQMSDAEIEARGGFALPSIGDFVGMLRQCNLDSPYNGDRHFVLRHPELVSEEEWRRRASRTGNGEWNVPGLRLLNAEVALLDERGHARAPDRPRRGRVEAIDAPLTAQVAG